MRNFPLKIILAILVLFVISYLLLFANMNNNKNIDNNYLNNKSTLKNISNKENIIIPKKNESRDKKLNTSVDNSADNESLDTSGSDGVGDETGIRIMIDPGHQIQSDYTKEQKGPNTDIVGTKVSQGTRGEFTGLWEYELNLIVGLKLRDILVDRGYRVYMTRTTNDVYITNMHRAKLANEKKVDLLISLHANAFSDKKSVKGIVTICMTKKSPYHPELHKKSRHFADLMLDNVCEATSAKKLYVWERDNLAVLNWCEMPSALLEMGFMTNKEEDKLLNTEDYQNKIANAVAKSIDEFFEQKNK